MSCSKDADEVPQTDDEDTETVELFSWWVSEGEADALDALLRVHAEQNPNILLVNSAVETDEENAAYLRRRLDEGDPPDVFQENIADVPTLMADYPDAIQPLDELFDAQGWADVFFPEVMDGITFDGTIFAMPVGMHRHNTLFYNRSILLANGIEPPSTLDEIMQACAVLLEAGVFCNTTGNDSWIHANTFHSLAMGTMGGQVYLDYLAGIGDQDNPDLEKAVALLETLLTTYTSEDYHQQGYGWQSAARAFFDGDAAFFFQGDWVGGFLQASGWESGIDYGAIGSPGAPEIFFYGIDIFLVPKAAKNQEGAFAFLQSVGSKEGQIAFNNLKGSTVIRNDIPPSSLSPVAQTTLKEFQDATVHVNSPYIDGFNDAFGAFSTDFDDAALLAFLKENAYGSVTWE